MASKTEKTEIKINEKKGEKKMKEIKIVEIKEIENKTTGRKFNAYKTVDKFGKKMDVRFTKTCTKIPTETCVIVVEDEMCNVDSNRQYPILWVKEVVEIKPYVRTSNVGDYFD